MISGGYPWGIDDGVKRLMAQSVIQSGGSSCVILPHFESSFCDEHFPIPSPYVEATKAGYRGIFPVFWPLLAGLCFAAFGPFGFYLLSAFAYTGLVFGVFRLFRYVGEKWRASWATSIIALPLLFYGLTVWEHTLALLLLIPLFAAYLKGKNENPRWMIVGIALGFAIYLRPETALLYPLIWLTRIGTIGEKTTRLLKLTAGMGLLFIFAAIFERLFTGRWWPPQAALNVGLSFQQVSFVERISSLFALLLDSPLPSIVFIIGLSVILVLTVFLRKPLISAIGLSSLGIGGIILGYLDHSAFALTVSSQGMFFAFPWSGLCLFRAGDKKLSEQPYLIFGWGYLILAFLLGPDQAGMHWGPRFLFPAIIPLILHVVQTFKVWSGKTVFWVTACTGLAVVINGAVSVQALMQRGKATSKVAEEILHKGNKILLVDRWHQGADLEPLWSDHALHWFAGPGEIEELLIELQDLGKVDTFSWIKSGTEYELNQFPVVILERLSLPNVAGWTGELLEARLEEEKHPLWGTVYWHAAMRRAAKENLTAAFHLFERAIAIIPRDADLRYDYSICLGKLGLTQKALTALKETLRLDPGHRAANVLWRQLGMP
jgi:hypothetical protein